MRAKQANAMPSKEQSMQSQHKHANKQHGSPPTQTKPTSRQEKKQSRGYIKVPRARANDHHMKMEKNRQRSRSHPIMPRYACIMPSSNNRKQRSRSLFACACPSTQMHACRRRCDVMLLKESKSEQGGCARVIMREGMRQPESKGWDNGARRGSSLTSAGCVPRNADEMRIVVMQKYQLRPV